MQSESTVTLTHSELEALVTKTVNQTLSSLGIDYSKPQELQRDMQHLRDWRLGTQQVKRHALFGAVTTVLAGSLAALWIGAKELLSK